MAAVVLRIVSSSFFWLASSCAAALTEAMANAPIAAAAAANAKAAFLPKSLTRSLKESTSVVAPLTPFFNESKSYLIVKGWYDSKEYVYDNQLQIVNLGRKETELTIKSVEPIDVKWLANEEFQCVLLKYTMGNNFPYSRIPSKIRTGELKKYKYIYDNWYKQ